MNFIRLTAALVAPARARELAALITILGIAASATNWVSFEHPIWYMGGQLLGYPLLAWLALRLSRAGGDEQPAAEAT